MSEGKGHMGNFVGGARVRIRSNMESKHDIHVIRVVVGGMHEFGSTTRFCI